MKNKFLKSIKKALLLFPLGLLFSVLINWTIFEGLISSIVFAVLFSFILIIYNWFEYEKYDNLELFDFLESQHSVTLDNNPQNWEILNTILDLQLTKIKSLTRTEKFTKIIIDQKIIDTILIILKNENNIEIRIRRKYLNFAPDMAENYKILKKLTSGIEKTTANNVYN